ncbi:MAG: hypothetical protein ACE5OW_03550 [Candidatus Bathyarchaeia archaeon]
MRDQQRIDEIIAKIRKAEEIGSYDFIHQELLEKRLGWYEENKDRLNLEGSEVRKAYTLLLIEYLGLDPGEVPVVYEDERKIVWRSYNFCPVLEACKRLGLDTRKICREGWEKSVQELISKINPNLKFSRNYKVIRPHAECCEEMIELTESCPLKSHHP